MKTHFRYTCATLLLSGLCCGAWAQTKLDRFVEFDLTRLLDVEITTASKKPQPASQSAAAVHVITAQDIQRSGATSLPELFRTVPGMQVAQITATTWAVSARGMNGRFANKLLVLIDGRTVYSPTFSGVYWDVQDTVLADIDRIEIIRGPGAALWGANAVNGVINIITKSAAATQGNLAQVGLDAAGGREVNLRYGSSSSDDLHWRLYAKASSRDGLRLQETGQQGEDTSRQSRVGYRADLAHGPHALTLQTEAYRGDSGETAVAIDLGLPAPFYRLQPIQQRVEGAFVLGRWQYHASPQHTHTVQTVADYSLRDWPLHMQDRQSLLEVDYQLRTQQWKHHDVLLGAAVRSTHNTILPSQPEGTVIGYARYDHERYRKTVSSLFVQDDISLVPQELILTLGGKLEKHSNYPSQWMPTARLMWQPNDHTTLWAAHTRAVRAPGHMDQGGDLRVLIPEIGNPQYFAPYPLLRIGGRFDTEHLEALELGWRQVLSPQSKLDVSVYRHAYDRLRSGQVTSDPQRDPRGFTPIDIALGNQTRMTAHGLEASLHWIPNYHLAFDWGVAYHRSRYSSAGEAFNLDAAGSAPKWAGHMTVQWRTSSQGRLHATVRHVGRLTDINYRIALPRYTAADVHYTHSPSERFSWQVGVVNLFAGRRVEGVSELRDTAAAQVEPTARAKLTWTY